MLYSTIVRAERKRLKIVRRRGSGAGAQFTAERGEGEERLTPHSLEVIAGEEVQIYPVCDVVTGLHVSSRRCLSCTLFGSSQTCRLSCKQGENFTWWKWEAGRAPSLGFLEKLAAMVRVTKRSS